MILPVPKKYSKKEGAFKAEIIYNENDNISLNAVKMLEYFAPDLICKKGRNQNIFFKIGDFAVKGAYRLNISESAIDICYRDYEGIRNAVSSLVQMKEADEIKCVEIFDEPDNDFRSCMLDLARGYVEISVIKEHLVRMSLMKFNYVHLHLMDRQSYALKSEVVPNPYNHRLYSRDEMSELTAFCKQLCLEVIPEIEIPAHAVNLIKALPELECDIIDKKKAYETIKNIENPRKREFSDNKKCVSSWAVCAGKESTYSIYAKIIKEITEIFEGEYIHIGGDELEIKSLGAHPHWDNCSFCKRKMQEENLPDRKALYYYVIRRVYDMIQEKSKKMIMWNDQLDVCDFIDIPKDIIIEYWNGNDEVYQKLIDMGFKTINAEDKYTYVDFPHYMNEEKIRQWNTHKEYTSSKKLEGQIMGGEMCAWELGNPRYSFYSYSLPVCMVLFADRVWNNQPVKYDDDYKQAVFSNTVGAFNGNINPLKFFNEIIPPRNIEKNMLEEIDLDSVNIEELKQTLSVMKKINGEDVYGKLALSEYIECIEAIKNLFY